jgi:fibronectin-binding autotransporter adhesin
MLGSTVHGGSTLTNSTAGTISVSGTGNVIGGTLINGGTVDISDGATLTLEGGGSYTNNGTIKIDANNANMTFALGAGRKPQVA